MKNIQFPVSEEIIRTLRVGEEISLNGVVVTARDAAHKLLVEEKPIFIKPLLENGAIYHCGPVMAFEEGSWKAIAAGPTTSIREEPYEATVIEEYSVRAVIGKGGMGKKTAEALVRCGAVYLHAVGGTAVSIADCIKTVDDVFLLERLGIPEALWVYNVSSMKAVVTMDSNGNSLHEKVFSESEIQRNRLFCESKFVG